MRRFGKGAVEDFRRLRIQPLVRAGRFKKVCTGQVCWSDGALMDYQTSSKYQIVVSYAFDPGGESKHYCYAIEIDWTPCNFGGERAWFRCPVCRCRVAMLLGPAPVFACRRCLSLSYTSQQTSKAKRDRLQSQKIRLRLGCEYSSYFVPAYAIAKPKNMKFRKFERIIERLTEVDRRVDIAIANLPPLKF